MSNKRKRIDNPKQQSLFDLLVETQAQIAFAENDEGSLDLRDPLRKCICMAIKQCSLSRYEIAGKISHLLGVDVSKTTIDAWTAESKEGHRMPAEYLPAFCAVTGDLTPIRIIAELAGMFALPGPDALRSEIRKLEEESKRILDEKKKRILFLKEMEEGK